MPKRKRAVRPVRENSQELHLEPHSVNSKKPANQLLPGNDFSCTQRFENLTAKGRAWVFNGNIYGNVEHHYNAASATHSASGSLDRSKDEMTANEMQDEDQRKRRQKEEQDRLFDEAVSSLLFPRMNFRYATIDSPQKETCGWMLETPEFTDWSQRQRQRDQCHNFLWIKSRPGAGKSTIIKHMVELAKAKGTRRSDRRQDGNQKVGKPVGIDIDVKFFFNARGDQLEKTAEGMFRSILHQLISQGKPEVYRAWFNLYITPSRAGWEWPLEILQAAFKDGVLGLGDDRLTCYIDALDECDEAQARDIVTFFENLSERAKDASIDFRICFASRHYPHITVANCLEINLDEQPGHEDDIRQYIRTNLKIAASDAHDVTKELEKRAAGVFLWVRFVVKKLNQESDGGGCSFTLRQRLAEIPVGLNELFENILESGGTDREDLILILQWIMFASRPLRCEELYHAVRTGLTSSAVFPAQDDCPSHETMAKFILHTSRGLAELTKGPIPVVQFIHESVRHFLEGAEGLRAIQQHSSLSFQGHSHERLKTCCQTYISADFVGQSAIPSAAQRLPFLQYAVHGVIHHANIAHHNDVSQNDFVTQFSPNKWNAIARLADPEHFSSTTMDTGCIFAEAKAEHLVRLVVRRDERFAARPGQYIERLGTVVKHKEASQVELLLLESHAEREEKEDNLKGLTKLSLDARYIYVMALLLESRWTGHIEDELCLQFLSWALADGHVEVAELLAFHISQLEDYAYSMLELATETGADAVVHILVTKLVGANFHDRRYGRLLRVAAYLGRFQIAKTLVDRGADVHFSSLRHGHVLWIAAKAGHASVVQLLCDSGAEVDKRVLGNMSTALQVACYHRHVETVRVLLRCGADVSKAGAEYGTSLEAAMYWPHSEWAKAIVQMLRRHGAVI